MKMAKGRRSILVFIVGLVVFQTTTYFWRAHKTMPVAGLKSLSDVGLLRSGKFVVLTQDTWPWDPGSALTPTQQAALCRVFRGYGTTVYGSIEDVPDGGKVFAPITTDDLRTYEITKTLKTTTRPDISPALLEKYRKDIEQGRKLVAFKDGMAFTWKLERRGLFWMKCTSSHWISGKGAEYRSDLFIWFLGRWLRVWNYHHEMAVVVRSKGDRSVRSKGE